MKKNVFEMKKKKFTYKEAGVDIQAADQNQEIIKQMIENTHSKNVIPDKEGLGAMFKIPKGFEEPILVSGSDGVGTKLKISFKMDKHDSIGIDLVAMCVNDVIRRGAKPLFFMDYIATGKLNQDKVNEIIKGMVKGCNQADCSLIGGETAQMPDFYKQGEYDLSGFCVGIVDKSRMISGKDIKPGDYIIGHELLTPTRIYVKTILDILENNFSDIKGLAHITGSAFNKLKRLNNQVGYKIQNLLPVPKIFDLIQTEGNISDKEMFSTFNMGIGFIIISETKNFLKGFEEKYGYKAEVIGKVDNSKKVKIKNKGIII